MSQEMNQVLYAKYNSLRKPEFRVTTEICDGANGKFVRKRAGEKAARAHLENIHANGIKLQDYYHDIHVIDSELSETELRFPYIQGRTLADAVGAGSFEKEAFINRVKEKLDAMLAVQDCYRTTFTMSDDFATIFGAVELEGVPAVSPANIDSLLTNFVENDTGIYCIDYEWVCPFPVPLGFIKYRALLYFYVNQAHSQLHEVSFGEMLTWFGITDTERELYWQMDDRFQQYVHGENRSYIYTEHYKKGILSIGDHESTVKDLQLQLKNANTRIQQLTIDFDTISNSFFWRITQPARSLLDWIKQFARKHSLLRVAKSISQHTLRYPKLHALMKKTYLVLRFGPEKAKELEKAPTPLLPVKHISIPWSTEEALVKERLVRFPRNVKFSILVPLYNTPDSFLREMIDSVRNQTYSNWELCLADGSDEEHESVGRICSEYMLSDKRIKYQKLEKNMGISGNSNACIEMATGNYIALFDHDDVLHPSALHRVMKAICEQDADYVYTDEVTFESPDRDKLITVHYKPDFAPDNLLANNYICHFSVFSAKLLEKVGGFRPEYDGSQDHDIILRLTEAAEHVIHIPEVLYWWRSHPQSVSQDIGAKEYAIDAAKRAVRDFLRDYKHVQAEVLSTRAFPTIFQIVYPIKQRDKVSIVIPNKDHVKDLKRCVNSLRKKTKYDNYEIIIVENNSVQKETFHYYDQLSADARIKVLHYDGSFNYSRINNWAVHQSDGEYIVLLNNDTEVISPEWLENMLMYAQREDVGAVGAKLYFPNGRIQHAGVVIKMGDDRIAAHAYYGASHDYIGYMGRLCYTQDVSAVTGACLMVKKSKYDEVEGLDENLAVAYNDVDFCLKLREKGYLNIFTPFAELKHHESASRGYETGEKLERFKKECSLFKGKWSGVLEKGDPYFNPNLSLDSPMFDPL